MVITRTKSIEGIGLVRRERLQLCVEIFDFRILIEKILQPADRPTILFTGVGEADTGATHKSSICSPHLFLREWYAMPLLLNIPQNFWISWTQKSITRHAAQFRDQDQQDAQEFLDSLLGILHEDLNLIKKKPRPVELTPEREAELESLPESVAADQEWQIYRERNDSVVIDFFQGESELTRFQGTTY